MTTTTLSYWEPAFDMPPVRVLLDKPDIPEIALAAIAGMSWRVTEIGTGLYDGWVRVRPVHPCLPEEIAVRRSDVVPDPGPDRPASSPHLARI